MKSKILVIFLALLLLTVLYDRDAQADDCAELPEGSDQKVTCYENKVKESLGQQKTLSSTIAYLDSKIALTQTQVYQTEAEIEKVEEEVATLSVKINRLDENLIDVSKLLVHRVGAIYKRRYIKPFYLFFSSGGFNEFFEKNKYLKVAQTNDKKLLLEMQESKNNLENKKHLKEEKQKELENLKITLQQQKSVVTRQIQEKEKLLAITKNDEIKYQDLLTKARAQRAAFGRFTAGATILSDQTKCDDWGCYYNQRDSQWGNKSIGNSISSMAQYGCLVTSMAMVASHYGKSLTPGDIANSTDPFVPGTAYMWQGTWTVNGVTTTRTNLGSSLSNIDNELNAGRPVIVGIYGGPDHFLVIKSKEDDEYIMHDPFPDGTANVKFTSKYPLNAISQVDKVTVH